MFCSCMIDIGTNSANKSFMVATKPICNTQRMFITLNLEACYHFFISPLDSIFEFLSDFYVFFAQWTRDDLRRLWLDPLHNASKT